MQIVTHVLVYRVFNNDCTPFTAKTGKTLAKLLLYYNSLNKVKLVCKVSECVLLFVEFKKSRITNPCGRQQQQQQHPACVGMTVAVQRIIHCHVQDRGEPFTSLTTKSGVNIWDALLDDCSQILCGIQVYR